MPPRFFVDAPLHAGVTLGLPAGAARHAQVLRLQPGDAVTLFDGRGGEWDAEVLRMGRSEVQARLRQRHEVERELPLAVVLALGMPANERMDALVEKATELGAAAIEPLVCARSVLRPDPERAQRRRAHWQAVAVAAAEQSGRTRVPQVHPVRSWAQAFADPSASDTQFVLSLRPTAVPWPEAAGARIADGRRVRLLSGPEGGLTDQEERLALAAGALAVSLGARTLRADTAPLAALAAIALQWAGR
ncbi:MAG: 16S rRNA (uracil(1498)-N(3))-methyltransferase [Betaproteobacteria bacterium]